MSITTLQERVSAPGITATLLPIMGVVFVAEDLKLNRRVALKVMMPEAAAHPTGRRRFLREVRPYVADAWIDRHAVDEQDGGIGKVGYEINFNREFFRYQPPRPLRVINEELAAVERRILELLKGVTE